jgi:hypothetical protein
MAKAINPMVINPLVVDCVHRVPSDTINNVSNVLAFVASAVNAAGDDDAEIFCTSGAGQGLGLILLTCRAALKYHCDKKGGAA